MAGSVVRVASYNVHSCVGTDGRYLPGRVADVVNELDAGIVGLQELADGGSVEPGGTEPKDELARLTGMTCIPGITLMTHRGPFGNALLTRFPVLDVRRFDLSVPGAEPRGAIDADLDCGGSALRVIVTHLGLRARERTQQVARLLEQIGQRPSGRLLVMGDFNEWAPLSARIRRLTQVLGPSIRPRSFPTWQPVFRLDRIWILPPGAGRDGGTHLSRLARLASDHFPVWASVALDGECAAGGGLPRSDVF